MQKKKLDTKIYKVGFYYTEYGVTYVHAKNEIEAELKFEKELSENGLEETDYECKDRDYGTTYAEEVGYDDNHQKDIYGY